jgi:hypothetical protein
MRKAIRMLLTAVALALAPAAAAAETRIGPMGQVCVDGRPVIPLGVWQQPDYLFDYNRQLGMNCLVWPPGSGERTQDEEPGYFEAASRSGLGCIVHYSERARSQPAVWGWIGGVVSPRNPGAAEGLRRIREQDPGHFIQVNVAAPRLLRGGDTESWAAALRQADCVVSHVWPQMLDPQKPDLRMVATLVDRLRECSRSRPGGEVSIWPDINPHQWTSTDGRIVYPAPSPAELRFQVWLALIHGADGICFFPISFKPFVFSQIPAQNEEELRRTTALVGRFTEMLTADPSPLAIEMRGSREGGIVDFTVRRHAGKDYVFLLNGCAEAQTVRLEVAGLGTSLRLRDAIRDLPLAAADGAHEENVPGLDLRIWELAPADEGARPAAGTDGLIRTGMPIE